MDRPGHDITLSAITREYYKEPDTGGPFVGAEDEPAIKRAALCTSLMDLVLLP